MKLSQERLTTLQWWAFAAMIIDHLGAYVVPEINPYARIIGRMAFPAFAWVFSYRLAEAVKNKNISYAQCGRLLWSGLASIPILMHLHAVCILSIMFTFLCVWILAWWDQQSEFEYDKKQYICGWLTIGLLVGWLGQKVEYDYGGIFLMMCMYAWHRKPSAFLLLSTAFVLAIISAVSDYPYAFLAPVFAGLVFLLSPPIPRGPKNILYFLYPLHLYFLIPGVHFAREMLRIVK